MYCREKVCSKAAQTPHLIKDYVFYVAFNLYLPLKHASSQGLTLGSVSPAFDHVRPGHFCKSGVRPGVGLTTNQGKSKEMCMCDRAIFAKVVYDRGSVSRQARSHDKGGGTFLEGLVHVKNTHTQRERRETKTKSQCRPA